MRNETVLFAYLRRAPFGGRLSQSQIDGVRRILKACEAESVRDLSQQAYVLASVFHETGARMQPVREAFASSDAQAKAALEKAWQAGKLGSVRTPYWRDGWFGRGDVQITHKANYEKLGRAIGVDLVRDPGLALVPEISARIAVVGMRDGLFAPGHTLERYFPTRGQQADDPINARRIVNGTDKRVLIAGHFEAFLGALRAAVMDGVIAPAPPEPAPDPDTARAPPIDVTPEACQPDDVRAVQSPTFWTGVAGAAASFVAAISNPWALGALALLMAGGAVWAISTGRISFSRRAA